MTFETFDQSDEWTWPDHQKDNDIDKYKDKTSLFKSAQIETKWPKMAQVDKINPVDSPLQE